MARAVNDIFHSGWFGKSLGLFAGMLWGLPDLLAMAACASGGVLIGHLYDRSIAPTTSSTLLMDVQLPTLKAGTGTTNSFIQFAFAAMGTVAKARGRVSEDSIRFAEDVMARMRLGEDDRRTAIHAFTQGKDPYADLEGMARRFRRAVGARSSLLQVTMELQCATARVDGPPDASCRQTLHRVRAMLGLSRRQFRQIEALVLDRNTHMPPKTPDVASRRLDEARELLGVAPDADARTLKRAYRRQMSRHHPDKVVGRGADAATVKAAESQAQRIVQAYELLSAAGD